MRRRLDEKVTEDEDLGKAAMAQQQQQRRKGGIGMRDWIVVSESGESHVEEVGKHAIMKRTGLPARELRVLDPVLSYPSTILGRERAIVINLEHIKAIATAKELFMIKSTNPLVVHFIQDLRDRVVSRRDIIISSNRDSNCCGIKPTNATETGMGAEQKSLCSTLPFEFKALEACLESACRCLESETQTLEQEAYPALDELSSKISTLNLERVRQIKSRLVAISGRVQKVRDELEHLLDDDNDMAEMYLTEKFQNQSMEITSGRDRYELTEELQTDEERDEEHYSGRHSETFTGVKPNVEELEMLLEAYFAQIDGVLQKLSHMTEYVDDTEDFINIMLDDKQNQLLQMGVMLSTGNMILNAGIVVVGLFGMNIEIALFSTEPKKFWQATFGTIGGCFLLYLVAVSWGRNKRLI